MPGKYSQVRAMLAITRGSLKAIFRSPSAVIFSFAFPLIFILVFGFIGNSGKISLHVAFSKDTDTTTNMYKAISSVDGLIRVNKSDAELQNDLSKGRLASIIQITHTSDPSPVYSIKLTSSEAVNPSSVQLLRSMIDGVINGMNKKIFPGNSTYATITNDVEQVPGRAYRTIDFILPGQLGFSLLSAGVFGVAFIFFSLRQTLVLKRFFATPIKKIIYRIRRSAEQDHFPDVHCADHIADWPFCI